MFHFSRAGPNDVLVHGRSPTEQIFPLVLPPGNQGEKKQNSGARGLLCDGLKVNVAPPWIKRKVVSSLGMCMDLGRGLSPISGLRT